MKAPAAICRPSRVVNTSDRRALAGGGRPRRARLLAIWAAGSSPLSTGGTKGLREVHIRAGRSGLKGQAAARLSASSPTSS